MGFMCFLPHAAAGEMDRWTKKLMDDGLQMIEDNGSINMINDLIFFP